MRSKSSRTFGNGRTFGRYSFLNISDRYSSSSLPKRLISSGVRNSGKYWSEPLPICARNFSRENCLPNRRNARSQESTCNSLESTRVPSISNMKASTEDKRIFFNLNRVSPVNCAEPPWHPRLFLNQTGSARFADGGCDSQDRTAV